MLHHVRRREHDTPDSLIQSVMSRRQEDIQTQVGRLGTSLGLPRVDLSVECSESI